MNKKIKIATDIQTIISVWGKKSDLNDLVQGEKRELFITYVLLILLPMYYLSK